MRCTLAALLRFAVGRFSFYLGFAAVLLCPLYGLAGDQMPCTNPAVFRNAVVNSLVLPYRYVGANPSPQIKRAEREIAGLVHFEILFSILKYGSVGGTDLVAVPGKVCDVDNVIAAVTVPGSRRSLLPGHVLVVTWGRIFEENEQLYLQSYLRFLQQGERQPLTERTVVKLKAGERPLEMTATLPTQGIAFPPVRISKGDLSRISENFRKSMVVRSKPDISVPGESIDFEPDRVFPYWISKTQGEWMYIEPMQGGPAGWARARMSAGEDGWSLQRWLPELAYVDAIAGFMRLRASERGGPEWVAEVRKAVDSGFAQFERAVAEQNAPAAYGLARAVQGFLALDFDEGNDAKAKAAQLFADARSLMPEYASARNLAAVTAPLRNGGNVDADTVGRLARRLVGALALDSSDAAALDNLDRLYSLYRELPEWSPHTPSELSEKISVLRAARARVPPNR